MISSYEEQRRRNIERNEEYLRQIGLLRSHDSSVSLQQQQKRQQQMKKRKSDKIGTDLPVAEARRSSRIAALGAVSYEEVQLQQLSSKDSRMKEKNTRKPIKEEINFDLKLGQVIGLDDLPITQMTKDQLKRETPSSDNCEGSQFASDLNAQLAHFLSPHLICTPLEQYGKAAVMSRAICHSSSSLLEQCSLPPPPPRFNKYSGAVAWKNCVFLWVNIGGCSGYTNAFSNEGRYMMWYGGSRMQKDSKIICRLVEAGRTSSAVKDKPLFKTEKGSVRSDTMKKETDAVILFVRREGEGYSCLGRLRWVAIDLDSHPIAIKWELMDYSLFNHFPYFEDIISK